MMMVDYVEKADAYLDYLCHVSPNRRTGSPGNLDATRFFARTILPFGFKIDVTPFKCLDYRLKASSLTSNSHNFDLCVSPYSLGCDIVSDLEVVSTIDDLRNSNITNKIVLMKGPICSEQLMPKNFVFYNPEHHKEIITLLESLNPAAIITATSKSPQQVGALYPFPLIYDGDFNIPNAYCKDIVGETLAGYRSNNFHLVIDADRIPSQAANVVAQRKKGNARKIVVTAHIDAYEDSPGALDNASGTVVLLLLAEMLSDYNGRYCTEILALNGEDHYSAGGQMDYLKRYCNELNNIDLAVNIDDIAYITGKSSYSFYECSKNITQKVENVLSTFPGLTNGEQWFNGDHMILVQNKVPSIAFMSELGSELMMNVTHTHRDLPELVDSNKLVEVAQAINTLIRSM